MAKKEYTVNHSRDATSLQSAFSQEGCPICTVVLEHMKHAMDTWNYEGFTDVEHRHTLIRIRGFCPLHTWQLTQHNNAFQLAVVYKEILTDVLETMDDENKTPRSGTESGWMDEVKRWFQPATPTPAVAPNLYAQCPFCHTRATAEQRVVERFVELLQSEQMQAQFRQSTGLCRLHFIQASQYAEEKKLSYRHTLIAAQRVCLQRTLDEIKELIRKHDYHFSDEPGGDEMTSWRRAAELCTGNNGVY